MFTVIFERVGYHRTYRMFPDISPPVGNCGFNGKDCTLIGTTLTNPGRGFSADVNLTEVLRNTSASMNIEGIFLGSHAFSVTGFKDYNGCGGTGANCK